MLREFLCTRFIPAYAGNSCLSTIPKCSLSVHPRLRGELRSTAKFHCSSDGSSPLTRGTRAGYRNARCPHRFIPAYAGNSVVPETTAMCKPVHPRLRGELSALTFTVVTPSGSSPLTRGTQKILINDVMLLRFIPAYAGNSSFRNC